MGGRRSFGSENGWRGVGRGMQLVVIDVTRVAVLDLLVFVAVTAMGGVEVGC